MNSTAEFDQYRGALHPTHRYSNVQILSANGRIGRFEYFFYSIIIPFLVFWIIAALAGISSRFGELGGAIAYVLLAAGFCAALIIYVQLTIQRCHDFNASGWLALLLILPFANIIFWLIPGNPVVNRFGGRPRPPSKLLRLGAGLLLLVLVAGATYFGLDYLGQSSR